MLFTRNKTTKNNFKNLHAIGGVGYKPTEDKLITHRRKIKLPTNTYKDRQYDYSSEKYKMKR